MPLNRETFITETIKLLEEQGYHGTSTRSILNACGAQKGSLYHFFPDGKEALVVEAIQVQADVMANVMQEMFAEHDTAADAVFTLMNAMAHQGEANNFCIGAPVAAIAQESATSNPQLRVACHDAYRKLTGVIQEKLLSDGLAQDKARGLAVSVIAAIEGAILLSRTEQTGAPLRDAAVSMRTLIEASV